MRKKFIKIKGGKGSVSYGLIIPKVLLEFIGCNLDKMDKTTVDIKLDSAGNKITISNPEINEE